MKRKFISLLIVLAVAAALAVPAFAAAGMANFRPTKTYAGEFTDLPAEEWYYSNVVNAYEYGFMIGSGDSFSPLGSLKVCEAIVIADRVYSLYHTGETVSLEAAEPWYTPYVDYAVEKGLIKENDFTDYEAEITRAQAAYVLTNALPTKEFKAINDVASVPDVDSENDPYAESILSFYKSGILKGVDEFGNYMPDATIDRSQTCAIISRITVPENRLSFVLNEKYALGNDAYFIYETGLEEKQQSDALVWSDSKKTLAVSFMEAYSDSYKNMPITLFTADEITSLLSDNMEAQGMTVNSITVSPVVIGGTDAYYAVMDLGVKNKTVSSHSYIYIKDGYYTEAVFMAKSEGLPIADIAASFRINDAAPIAK